ncbi:hypothetical protein C2S52_017634 [Perilla frutescens var. hirtella]|nr:hypothetical protein C2S52_017634 [Perilla frutescens var. hirtella]KAH6811402.1 hypothetical protein C2S51_025164 [Perilla frutescens var. frutescens]
MTFSPPSSPPPPPPPPFQANGSGVRAENGSSERCLSVGERDHTSRRRSDTTTHKIETEAEAAPPVKNEETILCCKTDGKSWQCRREAAKGNSLCEHHLSMVKSYSSNVGSHHAAKKSVKPPPPPQEAAAVDAPRRARPKKAPASANPYEFYYYSGFGPRWGKRRGEGRKNSSMPKNVGGDGDGSGEAEAEAVISNIEEFDYEEYEDEDEEDEEESRDNGRKRVRKPIKARSLKSLL